jgi:hypothetical protein
MTWIRGPLWDGVWILSGPAAGLAMLVAPPLVMLNILFYLNMAHLVSPLAVAWGSRPFRQIMYKQWGKYIVFPISIMVTVLLIGITVGKVFEVNPITLGVRVYDMRDYLQPFVIMFVVYFFWNAYHFGMQHFGILSLYRRGRRSRTQRRVDMWLCLGLTTVLGMILLPRIVHIQQVAMFAIGFFAFNHSMAAIGISSHVLARRHGLSPWLFVALLLAAGAIVFWLLFYAPGFSIRVTMTALALRIGLGFVHFLYDRWVYKLSDPKVRAIMGPAFLTEHAYA